MVLTVDEKMENSAEFELDEALTSKQLLNTLMNGRFHILQLDFDKNKLLISSQDTIDSDTVFTDNSTSILIFPEENSHSVTTGLLDKFEFALSVTRHLHYQLNNIISLQQEAHQLRQEIIQQKRKNKEIEIIKNAIVRNVSHELRTPLLQVKSAVSLICEDSADISLNNYAQNAVARLETHIKNITMLGHSLDIKVNPIVLYDSIDSAKRNLTRIWTYRNETPSIQIDLEKNLPPIMADKQGLGTVFQLLMDNALKFSDNQEIRVTGRRVGDTVRVAIHDNGIGIADDKISSIFDSFYQVDATSTRPYGGAGVGLTIVKLILDYHGIDIRVDSEMEKGSTFWFDIPSVDLDTIK